jgi:hypothetical protein
MTHFLYRSQQGAPSEAILEDSRGSGKELSIPDLPSGPPHRGLKFIDHRYRLRSSPEASHPGIDRQFDKIAVTAYLASSDDSSRVNISRIVPLPLQHSF